MFTRLHLDRVATLAAHSPHQAAELFLLPNVVPCELVEARLDESGRVWVGVDEWGEDGGVATRRKLFKS